MRRFVGVMTLAGILAVFSGCGRSADAPPKELTEAEKKQKMDEAKAAMEKGVKDSMEKRGSRPQ